MKTLILTASSCVLAVFLAGCSAMSSKQIVTVNDWIINDAGATNMVDSLFTADIEQTGVGNAKRVVESEYGTVTFETSNSDFISGAVQSSVNLVGAVAGLTWRAAGAAF